MVSGDIVVLGAFERRAITKQILCLSITSQALKALDVIVLVTSPLNSTHIAMQIVCGKDLHSLQAFVSYVIDLRHWKLVLCHFLFFSFANLA